MKKFTFPLARVMDWRRTQVQIEESKLEQLYRQLRGFETQISHALAARRQSEQALLITGSALGSELAALDNFKTASAAHCAQLAQSAAAIQQQIAAQLQVVIQKRRDLKLLELLHDRKLAAWKLESDREIDREAGELHLAAFATRAHPGRSAR